MTSTMTRVEINSFVKLTMLKKEKIRPSKSRLLAKNFKKMQNIRRMFERKFALKIEVTNLKDTKLGNYECNPVLGVK